MEERYTSFNRRSYTRYIIEAAATLVINDSVRVPVVLRDISARGAGVFSNYPLTANDKVEIIIDYYFQRPVCRKANVVWSKEEDNNLWRAGLDFGVDNLLEVTQFS
ncbi:MAG: PilZ domain-containing protein [Candidatus Omnitrophica bacterium]|nr:PilZ domain-containing protein [Candidatus Omnitrophota bacterium]